MTSIGIIRITRKYGLGLATRILTPSILLLLGCVSEVQAQPPQRPSLGRANSENSEPAADQSWSGSSGRGLSGGAVAAEGMDSGESSNLSEQPLDRLDPEVVIRRAIWQAVWGDPVTSRVRQRIAMYDKELVGVGSYCHAGKGSSKLKWQMRFAAADSVTNYLQISDGRLLWTSKQVEEKIEVHRVDLDPIRNRIGPVRESDLANPLLAMELAVGGQAELLRSLYHRYDWETAVPTKLDQQPVWLLTGEIRQQPPIPSARAPVDQAMLKASQTGLLPQRVRLALGRTEQFPFFPHRIEYFKRKESKESGGWDLLTIIEFFEVASPGTLEPELFQYEVRDTVEAIHDETSNYLPASPLHLTRQPDAKTR